MIVVIDTNIWLGELALNSALGSAVRFFLLHRNARVMLPEVIRLETERHLRAMLREQVAKIRDNHQRLLAVFGRLDEIALPSDAAIDAKVYEVFQTLGVACVDVPFCLDSARSSFLKTIDKLAPSDRDQQFKDGVLWADCVALLRDDDVSLVSADKVFFHQRDYAQGRAKNLTAEQKASPILCVYSVRCTICSPISGLISRWTNGR